MAANAETIDLSDLQQMLKWQQAGTNLRRRRALIKKLRDSIVRHFQPDKIILFGSYAYGHPNVDSDVDLLVIMPFEDDPLRQAGKMHYRITSDEGYLPIDLLVRTPEQLRYRLSIGDRFMQEITEKGTVIYEANPTGVGG